jgi:hypothetical protein
MKKIHILGVTLFAVFAFCAVAAASALATPEFLDNGESILASTTFLSEIMSNGAGFGLLLEDMGNSTEVECMLGVNEGLLSTTAGLAEITEALCTEGLAVSGLCSAPVTIVALNLPWEVTLTLVIEGGANMYRAAPTNAAENTGYLVECETVLGKQDDPCTGKGVTFLLENAAEGAVLAESDAKTEEESETNILCTGTLGGKGLILAGSDILLFSDEGLVLSVATPEFLDNGEPVLASTTFLSELMTNSEGVGLLLEDMGNSTEVECMKGTNEGILSATSGLGSITVAECSEALAVSGLCSSPTTIKALNLPWEVEVLLVEEGGVNMYRARLSNEAENTGYLVECETALGKGDDPCTGKGVTYLLENAAEGAVLAESDAKTEEESEANILCTGTVGGKGLILAGSDFLLFSDEGLALTVSG